MATQKTLATPEIRPDKDEVRIESYCRKPALGLLEICVSKGHMDAGKFVVDEQQVYKLIGVDHDAIIDELGDAAKKASETVEDKIWDYLTAQGIATT